MTKWNASASPVFERNLDANLQMLEALLRAAEERGVQRRSCSSCRSTRRSSGTASTTPSGSTRSRSRSWRRKYECPYLDFNQEVAIPSADFQDLSHLIAPGRVIWQHALAQELARLMGAADSGGSSG